MSASPKRAIFPRAACSSPAGEVPEGGRGLLSFRTGRVLAPQADAVTHDDAITRVLAKLGKPLPPSATSPAGSLQARLGRIASIDPSEASS